MSDLNPEFCGSDSHLGHQSDVSRDRSQPKRLINIGLWRCGVIGKRVRLKIEILWVRVPSPLPNLDSNKTIYVGDAMTQLNATKEEKTMNGGPISDKNVGS